MALADAYLAAFRGGDPPHPVHPQSRAWHEQYVDVDGQDDQNLYRHGRLRSTGERVFSFIGAWAWYRLADFRELCAGAKDERYRSLAALR